MKISKDDIIFDKYKIIDKIDEGSFGFVYKALDISFENIVAIKCIKNNNINIRLHFGMNEVRFLKTLKHENIIQLINYFEIENNFYIVYEYASTDLLKFYQHFKNKVCLLEYEFIIKLY